jgi:hypothetical protein
MAIRHGQSGLKIMYCPKCGQERGSEATSFCSRCGFLLTGAAELLHTGGMLPNAAPIQIEPSPRSRGIKQGLFIFLLTFLVAPILGMISVFLFRMPPWPMGIAIFLLGGGGLLRMVYAAMFESKYPAGLPAGASLRIDPQPTLNPTAARGELPPQQVYPASQYATPRTGRWLDTNDLEPPSVTDSTTKLLERD